MLNNSRDVLFHELLHFPGVLEALDPPRDPRTVLGPDERVATHLHAILLGEVLDAIASAEVVLALVPDDR